MNLDQIDRIGPTLRPPSAALLHQNWHHLLFLHWEIPPLELQALLPSGLDLDTFHGKSYVGIVPFTMTGVRASFTPPLPWVSSFHEINVRTYVHQKGRNPGVWFFSLDASSALAVAAARATYHLPYFNAAIEMTVPEKAFPTIDFHCRREDPNSPSPAHGHFQYTGQEGAVGPAAPGTLEHFLIERYILYSVDSSGKLHRARVHHQPYPLQPVTVDQMEETLIWAAGIKRPESVPLRHYAKEVNVEIFGLEETGDPA